MKYILMFFAVFSASIYADIDCTSLPSNLLGCDELDDGFAQRQCLATQDFFTRVDEKYCRSQCYGNCPEDIITTTTDV